MDYDESDNLTARLAYVSDVYKSWWRAWYQQVLPTLVPCRKWKREVRNLEIGDIVFMYYPPASKTTISWPRSWKYFLIPRA